MSDAQPPTTASSAAAGRVFPRPETALAQLIGDPAYRAAFHKRLRASNRYVVFFYRIGLLPLLGAGETTMLLTTRGRKTQRLRTFPVGFFRIGGEIHLISGWAKDANWYKNIQRNPREAWLQVGFRRFSVTAHVIEDPTEIKETIHRLVRESPTGAKRLIGWDPGSDNLSSADFSPMIQKVLFVRFVRAQAG